MSALSAIPISSQSIVSKPLVERIIVAACMHYNITEDELKAGASYDVATMRHICWYLIAENVTISNARIGQRFGNVAHSTVLRGVDKIRAHKNIYAQTAHDIRKIIELADTLA